MESMMALSKATSLPEWLLKLRGESATDCGIHWFSDEQIAERWSETLEEKGHLKRYSQMARPDDGSLKKDADEILRRAVPVGIASDGGHFSVSHRILGAIETYPAEFWFDPAAPDSLLCSLNGFFPPHLWFPVGTTQDAIDAALSIYFANLPAPGPVEGAASYAARLRAGSADWDDPPPEWVSSRVFFCVVGDMRIVENEFPRRSESCRSFDALATAADPNDLVPKTMFRTVNSLSRISLELHRWARYGDGEEPLFPVVAELHYPPADQADQIRRINQALDTDFCLDIPLDVVAAVFGYPVKGLPRLHSALIPEASEQEILDLFALVSTTDGDGQAVCERFREFSAHPSPDIRARVARYAVVRGFPELTREMIAAEQHPGLRSYMLSLVGEREET